MSLFNGPAQIGRLRYAAAAVGIIGVAILAVRLLRPDAGGAPLQLEVDVSERVLSVHHGGEVISTYDVAVGTAQHSTPRGEFTISRVVWNPSWVPPESEWAEGERRRAPDDPDNPMEAVKMIFKGPAYYIHGTNAAQSLGTAASHGCVRMAPAAAESLAEQVQEHGGAGRSAEWYETVRREESQTRSIALPSPVPIAIHD